MLTYLKGRFMIASTGSNPITKGAARRLMKECDSLLKL